MHYFKRVVAALAMLALAFSGAGCKTMQSVDMVAGQQLLIEEEVKVGDKVELIQKDGYINTFTVGKITERTISGNSEFGSLVMIGLDDIESIRVEKIHPGLTAAAVLGVVVAIPIVLIGASFGLMMSAQ